VIDGSIVVEVLQIQANRVRVGIQAPSGVTILREELILDNDTAVAHPGGGSLPEQANTAQLSPLVSLLGNTP
jgi:hypothetical protein